MRRGSDNGGRVNLLGAFLESDDKVLVCSHATFRFAVDRFGVEAFDERLIAVDEFHHRDVPVKSSACRGLATSCSGLRHFLGIAVLLFMPKGIPRCGPVSMGVDRAREEAVALQLATAGNENATIVLSVVIAGVAKR
jgi:hypothetical protein